MSVRRYLRTLSLFWRTSVAAEMEYRSNFLLACLASLGNLVGSVFGLFLFYRGDYTFEGWAWEESILVLGVFTLLTGFTSTVLTPNLNRIVQQVEDGTLDFVLLKPMDSQLWVSLRQLSPWGAPDVAFGGALVLYSTVQLGLPAGTLVLGALPLLAGLAILYGLWFFLASMSIWFVKVYNATEVLRGLLDAGRFPMSAYPAAYRFFFTFIVPVAFLTTVPAEAVLGRGDLRWLGGAALLAVGLLLASRFFWRVALRSYTSASS
jgi:ABC-2 type transport system permease protein